LADGTEVIYLVVNDSEDSPTPIECDLPESENIAANNARVMALFFKVSGEDAQSLHRSKTCSRKANRSRVLATLRFAAERPDCGSSSRLKHAVYCMYFIYDRERRPGIQKSGYPMRSGIFKSKPPPRFNCLVGVGYYDLDTRAGIKRVKWVPWKPNVAISSHEIYRFSYPNLLDQEWPTNAELVETRLKSVGVLFEEAIQNN
jgi:hypothetical protein